MKSLRLTLRRALSFTKEPTGAGATIGNRSRSRFKQAVADYGESDLELPVELLLQVLSHLSVTNLLKCRLVNKWFKRVIDDTPEIQYSIELEASGMCNNEACTELGATARLTTLMAEQAFWKKPKGVWTRASLGDWVHDSFNVRYYQNTWVRCGKKGDVPEASRWDIIQCVCWEPLKDGGAVTDTWTLSFPFSFQCFAADPSQDLLYLLDTRTVPGERTMRLWTYSLLKGDWIDETLLHVESETPFDWSVYIMDARDTTIGVVTFEHVAGDLSGAICQVTLIDRAADVVIGNIRRVGLPLESRIGFQILTESCFLLHIFTNAWSQTEVYSISRCPLTGKRASHLASTFQYPKVKLSFIQSSREQTELLGRTRGGSLSRHAPPRSLTVPESASILYLMRCFGNSTGGFTRFIHVVPVSIFISTTVSFPLHPGNYTPPIIPWNDWGPTQSRCFLDHGSQILATYGYKVLLSDFTLLDFNPLEIARDLHRAGHNSVQSDGRRKAHGWGVFKKAPKPSKPKLADVSLPGDAGRIVQQPTTIPAAEMFEEDLVTTLPYRETKLPWSGPDPTFVSGGEVWVVGTQHLLEDGTRENEYHWFRPDFS